ncbi:Nucleolar protein 12 [Podospora bellae-mahoneyi]|uniref:Nucleolar protein 12 n=1 Tax=Podospora bellae-mahoneyi TaxID=2093777 RepID=A0ABR0FUR4_9PEZI|nr:Nucleolar protein 12 [Podospora bellae-mahoneyi]
MAKSKSLSAPSKAVDPALDSLFSTSAGPVQAPPKSRYSELPPPKSDDAPEESDEEDEDEEDEEEDDEELSELEDGADLEDLVDMEASEESGEEDDNDSENDEDDEDEDDASDSMSVDNEAEAAEVLESAAAKSKAEEEDGRKRKRKQRNDDEDLEAKYFERLQEDDEEERSGKRRKDANGKAAAVEKTEKTGDKDSDLDSDAEVPKHESLTANDAASELEKANRTVFLSNVSLEATTSRTAKKTLLKHLASILDPKADPPQKVESIRFRSTAFATAAIPKRAAFIKKEVMEATTKCTNAYAVYSTPQAVRLAVQKLNGTVVLDRHLRVDSVAHPAPVDHKRCVFVGNLGFVDDETVLNVKVDDEGNQTTTKKKRTKQPMDVEEGLWRVFGKEAGKVESVRVVRDNVTRVGKGIAYVQFYDGNDVEKAILLEGKKFPPMLPRELRVSRCKALHKTARALEAKHGKAGPPSKGDRKGRKGSSYVPKITPEDKTLAGRAGKLLGRGGAAKLTGEDKRKDRKDRPRRESAGAPQSQPGGIRPPEDFVFEGKRASAKDGKPKDLKFKGARNGEKRGYKKKTGPGGPTGRGAARAAKWREGGAKK